MLPARKHITYLVLLIIISIALLLTSSVPVSAREESSYAASSPKEFADSMDKSFKGELEGRAYSGGFIPDNLMYGISCKTIGAPCSNDPERSINFIQRSALGTTTKLIATTYAYPVASSTYYLADLGTRLGVPPSYAQGIGFGGLRPILGLWKAFRNIAYSLLIIVLIAIGFMVMFRIKIDPRTVITVQAALPRIIITLLLITFSYAIAGFLIDIMYLAILLLVSIVHSSNPAIFPPIETTQAWYLTGGTAALFSGTFGVIPQKMWTDLGTWLAGAGIGAIIGGGALAFIPVVGPLLAVGALPALLIGGVLGGSAGGFLGGGGGLTGAFNPIIFFLVALGLLFMFIRIFFLLINAYIQVIVGVIFAPIQLMFDALPVGGGSFGRWIRNLIANLAVFPAVVVLLLIGRAISTSLGSGNESSPLWSPPLVPAWTKDAAQFVIGFGVVTLIPTLVGALKEMLKAKPALPIGIGAPITPFIAGAQTALGVAGQFHYAQLGLQMIKEAAKGTASRIRGQG